MFPIPAIMTKYLLLLSCVSLGWAQDYKLEPIAAGASDVPAAYASVLDTKGYRVVGPSGPWCEVWFRKSIPAGPKSSDPAITLSIAQGTLLGVIRFPGKAADRRDQSLKPGIYTMRYSDYPVDGAHQGVAPQRDFALLTPIANDPDPAAMPNFDKLVEQSRTSGTPHPAVLSLETPAGSAFPAVTKEGDHDVVLNVKVGDLGLSIIVSGKAEG
ncbi:MAG TPA: hypothetical protein VKU19_22715 [Bryobacteraceae bacterium]|nr:hypothetical protein [Bryobacteraceae bacterium]